MSNPASGTCPKCSEPNAYTDTICSACGGRLPWADAVASQPIGIWAPSHVKPAVQVKKTFFLNDSWRVGLICWSAVIIAILISIPIANFFVSGNIFYAR